MISQSNVRWPNGASQRSLKTGKFKFRLLNTDLHDHSKIEQHSKYRRAYTVSDYIEHALSIASFEDFFLFASKLKNDCGFSMSGGGVSQKSINANPSAYFFYSCTEWGWPAYYASRLIQDDPTVYYCQNNVLPLVLESRKDFRFIRQLSPELADAMSSFGIKGFVTIPTHGADTSLSGFRFAVTKDDVLTRSDIDNQLPLMSFLSTLMHEALSRVLNVDDKSKGIMLTTREQEILRWVASGLSTWEVSENLHISENTVLTHMKNLHTKLGVKTRQHAVAKALSLNLI